MFEANPCIEVRVKTDKMGGAPSQGLALGFILTWIASTLSHSSSFFMMGFHFPTMTPLLNTNFLISMIS